MAITCDRRLGPAGTGPNLRPARMQVGVGTSLVQRVQAAGGLAILVPPGPADLAGEVLDRADALLVTGGAFDIHPGHYGEAPRGRLDDVDDARTRLELALIRLALARDLPILGICGGMQALAVARGGTLHQDIATELPGALRHEQPTDPAEPWHALEVEPAWGHLFPPAVNSTHHQAVRDPADLSVGARASDGVIEAVVLRSARFAIGVQWHPELLDDALFTALLDAARDRGVGSA